MNTNEFKTETEAVAELARRGFSANFKLEKGFVSSLDTGEKFKPEDLTIMEFHRFEGKSDPEDMSVIYAVESQSGTKGLIIGGFGPYSDPLLNDLIEKIPFSEERITSALRKKNSGANAH